MSEKEHGGCSINAVRAWRTVGAFTLAKSALGLRPREDPEAPRPDPLCSHPWESSATWLLPAHLCRDQGVLRGPREAGATELGGSAPFCLHVRLRLKTKLSDFRTFHSGKNNYTWGKHADTSQSHLVAATMCQKLLELTGLVCHAPTVPALPASPPEAPSPMCQTPARKRRPGDAMSHLCLPSPCAASGPGPKSPSHRCLI